MNNPVYTATQLAPTIAGLISPRSKHKLGWWYEAGITPIQAHPRKARQWYQRAAKQGNPWAGYRLGWLYENGYGGKKDAFAAYHCYSQAAQQGKAALYNLAR